MKNATTTFLLFLSIYSFSFGQKAIIETKKKIAIVKTTLSNGEMMVRKVPWEKNTNIQEFKKKFGLELDFISEIEVQIVEKGSIADINTKEEKVYTVTSSIKSKSQSPKKAKGQVVNIDSEKRYVNPMIPYLLVENPHDEGLLVIEKMRQYPIEKKLLKKGDIITVINDQKITNWTDFYRKSVFAKTGNTCKLEIIRKGREIQISEFPLVEYPEQRLIPDYLYSNPCQVQIGVYFSGGSRGGAVRIRNVGENTSAEKMGILKGDFVTAFDGKQVITRNDILRERNSNKSGDFFTLTIFRNGKKMKLTGQFAPCEEISEVEVSAQTSKPSEINHNQVLLIKEKYQVFPNPTTGDFSIQMPLNKSAPVEILVTNLNGELILFRNVEIHENKLLNEIFDLKGLAAGIYVISVFQNEKLFTENIILMN